MLKRKINVVMACQRTNEKSESSAVPIKQFQVNLPITVQRKPSSMTNLLPKPNNYSGAGVGLSVEGHATAGHTSTQFLDEISSIILNGEVNSADANVPEKVETSSEFVPRKTVWMCPLCPWPAERFFERKRHFIFHLQSEIHSEGKPHKCLICSDYDERKPVTLSTSSNLRSHAFSFHLEARTNQKRVTCKPCGEKFSDKTEFFHHFQLNHSSRNVAVCPLCDLGFPDETYLDRHLEFHPNCRGFQQDLSGKSTASDGLRTVVNNVYFCDLCESVAATNLDVITHLIEEHELKGKSAFLDRAKICNRVPTGQGNVHGIKKLSGKMGNFPQMSGKNDSL